MPPILERVVPATYQEVGTLRRATAAFLRDADDQVRDAVVLTVSELATNAVEALNDPTGEVVLLVRDYHDRVEIELSDCGPGFGGALQRPGSGDNEPRGRGLQVVQSLVDHFAVRRRGDQTTVRCVVYR